MSENDMKDWVFVPEEEPMCEPVEVAPAIRIDDFIVEGWICVEKLTDEA